MNRLLIKMLCACILLGITALPPASANTAGSGISAESVDEYVLRLMDQMDLPGVSVAVLRGDKTYVKGMAKLTPAGIYR